MDPELQSSPFPVVFAVFFSMALAICVALFCVASLQKEPLAPGDGTSSISGSALSEPPASSVDTTASAEPLTGLRFVSNGDGSCRVVGVGSCSDAHVVIPDRAPNGETVVGIAPRAFYACNTLTAVQIPATVTEIGELAFAACQNLSYISVSPRNPAFRDLDGVLYTADGRILLQYPPLRAGAQLVIRKETVAIAEMAFYECAHLNAVRFTGTAEEWEAISIGAKNYSLTAAAKEFGVFSE